MADEHDWCFAWKAGATLRGAMPRESKWEDDERVITVSFLDDDHGLRERVAGYARRWTRDDDPAMANLRFDFRDDTNDTFIRISFRGAGNSSAVGRTCLEITDLAEPTMNLGGLNASSTEEAVRRAVLHEFGHALGLIHEHQNPSGGINWNEPAVYRDLMRGPSGWTRDQVRENMFDLYAADTTNFTDFDPSSIMVYPIPARWTTDSFSVGWNTQLSDRDKAFIAEQYP